jgi:hypothetical protein
MNQWQFGAYKCCLRILVGVLEYAAVIPTPGGLKREQNITDNAVRNIQFTRMQGMVALWYTKALPNS